MSAIAKSPHADESPCCNAPWTIGDFGRIATCYAVDAGAFVARLGFAPGERVLDVACGTGNVAIPAARAGADVVGVDLVPSLLAQGRAAAAEEGLDVRFDAADCEALPYADASFDAALTMFGVMYAAHPERAAAELLRVVRPGGRIAMANWTPGGFVGEVTRLTDAPAAAAAGVPSPLQWGDPEVVRDRLGGAASVACARRHVVLEFPFAPPAVVEHFRVWHGPTHRAFAALDARAGARLRDALVTLWSEHNRATDGTTRVDGEFLEVVAVR
jgi:SAM-dependent methyltransferase